MIRIGNNYNKEVRCLISNMDTPLGICVGNALEVAEAAELLNGKVRNDLYDLCVDIASNMISMAKEISIIDAREQVIESLNTKKAYAKFMEFISYQSGNLEEMDISNNKMEIKSSVKGTLTAIDAYKISEVSCKLGSGKLTKEDIIDPSVGVFLNKQVGDEIEVGDVLCTLYYNKVQEDFGVASAFTVV
jgi:pyrimidine-nucleoside phosphorylase